MTSAGMRVIALGLLLSSGTVGRAGERHPLAPPDTSSPRATLQTFLDTTSEIEQALIAYRAAPDRHDGLKIMRLGERAVRTMDVSALPPASLRERAARAAQLLWEVLARLELPPLTEVPDASAFPAETPQARWTIPETEITITRVAEGPRAGEFLFSVHTVERLEEFYEKVRHLPYLRPMPIGSPLQQFIELTGWMIPASLVVMLPSWSRTLVFATPLWKLLAFGLVLGLAGLALAVIYRWTLPRPADSLPREHLRRLVLPIAVLLLAMTLHGVFLVQINLQGEVAEVVEFALAIAGYLAGAWAVYLAAMLVAEAMIASPRIPDESLDANLLRLAARVVGVGTAIVIAARGAGDLGVPVVGILAGLGIGGLAVALAAQNTLGNLLGSLNIFADRPVRVGDSCRYGGDIGTIEHIGIRSTRIRGIDRTVTTMPNAELAQMPITNFSRRDSILFQKRLDLRHETTPDQLRLLLIELRALLRTHPRVRAESVQVSLVDVAGASVQVELFAYVGTSDGFEYLAIQQDLLLRILELVDRMGAGLALPAQRTYVPRDPRLDAADADAAAAEVARLRGIGPLPLPEFGTGRRGE